VKDIYQRNKNSSKELRTKPAHKTLCMPPLYSMSMITVWHNALSSLCCQSKDDQRSDLYTPSAVVTTSSGGTLARIRAWLPRNRSWVRGSDKRFLSSPKCTGRLWGPPSLQVNVGASSLLPKIRRGVKLTTHLI